MKFKLNAVLASLVGLAISMSVIAEDIELYVNYNVETKEKPRVMMIFDTSGSMAWDVTDGEQCYQWDGGSTSSPRFYQSTCFESSGSRDTKDCFKKANSGTKRGRFYNGPTTNGYDYSYSNNYYDNTCNDSRLNVAQNAIKQLVNDNDDIDFGLMRFNGSDGGYVLARVGPIK